MAKKSFLIMDVDQTEDDLRNIDPSEMSGRKWTLFDHLDEIYVNQTEMKEEDFGRIKSYSNFMINRFLSFNSECTLFCDIMNSNKFSKIEPSTHYSFFKNVIQKKRKKPFIPVPKKSKKDEYTKEDKLALMKRYQLGTRDLELVMDIFEPSELKIHDGLNFKR